MSNINKLIGDKGNWNRIDDSLVEKLNKEAEEEKRKKKTPPEINPEQKKQNKNPLEIKTIDDYWQIEGVNYNGEIYIVDLAKSLLDNGKSKTQDKWAEYREQAIKANEFYTGDMPLYHAVFSALFNQKDKPESEEAREFIQKQMREKYPITLTRIAYQPKGKDKVIHNYGTSQKYEINENIVGKDREIIAGDSNALTALLRDGDIDKIKSVYNWINQTPTWIWRVNSKPESIDERIARFVAGSDGAYLLCGRDATLADASLGVRLVVRPKGATAKSK
jgi:hypothetical protein